jgi:hypothetical protein
MAGNRLPLKAQLEAASASNRASHARIRVEGASIRPFDPDLLPPTHAGWAVPVRRLTPLNKAREPGDRATPRDVAHNEAPEGTGGRTGQSVRTGSEQVRSRYAPPETLARRPCGRRTRFPGPSRGSLPGAVWRFAPAPSGKTNSTGRGHDVTTALSTNFREIRGGLSPTFPRMWTTCGWLRMQRACNIRSRLTRRRFPSEVGVGWHGSWRDCRP